jgi:hypothetical protein
MKLRERGIAFLIFNMYEKVLFDLKTFNKKNRDETAFLEAVLSYMQSQWLRNPRLHYF